MERQELLDKMLNILGDVRNDRLEIQKLESEKETQLQILNTEIAKIEVDVFCDETLKNKDARESVITRRKQENSIYTQAISKVRELDSQINKIKIDVEYLDNLWKTYRVVYGEYKW